MGCNNINTMGEVRKFEYAGATYQLTPGVANYWAAIRTYHIYNKDSDDIISDKEIEKYAPPGLKDTLLDTLAHAAAIFGKLEKIPTLQLPYEKYRDDMSDRVAERLKLVKPLDIKATSTAKDDPRDDEDHSIVSASKIAERTAKAWGVYEYNLNFSIEKSVRMLLPVGMEGLVVSDILNTEVSQDRRILFIDDKGGVVKEIFHYNDSFRFDSLTVSPNALIAGNAFVDERRGDFEIASAILDKHHPDITLGNLGSFLASSFVMEIAALQREDVIQDVAVCRAVDCAVREGYQRLFPTLLEQFWGEPIGWWNGIGDLLMWELGSLFVSGKENQGYGIGQIISGLAMEAAADKELLRDYRPHLSESDFKDFDSTLRAIMDPKKVVFVKALTLDYTTKKAERGLFSPPVNLTMPIDRACPTTNRKTAREVVLLFGALRFMAFPESAREADKTFVYDYPGIMDISHFSYLGEITGFPLKLDGVVVGKISDEVFFNSREQVESYGDPDIKIGDNIPAIRLRMYCY